MTYSLAIHGGAGTILRSQITQEDEVKYNHALHDALVAGNDVLIKGGNAVEAVAASVVSLENCPLFNAGKGSVFSNEWKHEMDASIMDGTNLQAGAVSMLHNVKNPVLLAKEIMQKSEHVYLCGEGAERYAH
ncbi:MAG: isoaspartyl peptidase/L-asparaginase, partial [Saprospiraceae bacterium]|nr:isoaspartyl peptidase/L-asparaginase [Saprospiraceae bacterium]